MIMERSFSIEGKEISAASVMEDYQVRYSAPWVLSVNIVPGTAAGLQPAPKRGGQEDKGKGKGKGKEKGEGKGKSTKGYLGSTAPASAPATTLSSSQREKKDKKEKKEKRDKTEEEQAAKAAKHILQDKKEKKAAASTTTEEKKVRKKKKKKPQETTMPTVRTYAANGFSMKSTRPVVGLARVQS